MTDKELISSYNLVHNKTWTSNDFQLDQLEKSRSLFTDESLKLRKPITKKLHVFAFLFGIPFTKKQQEILVNFQNGIREIIGSKLAYYVKPKNLGLELAVIKWHDQDLNEKLIESSQKIVNKEFNKEKTIKLLINGFQINPDGCFVARGIDTSGEFLSLRKRIMKDESVFPRRQSGWVHIPLGRLLEPVGTELFHALKKKVGESLQLEPIEFGEIGNLKLVEETQWYMEEKELVQQF